MVRKARNLCAHNVRNTSNMRSRIVMPRVGRSRQEKVTLSAPLLDTQGTGILLQEKFRSERFMREEGQL
jgi:hypothetical protein